VLGVVPHAGDGVAVKVAHGERVGGGLGGSASVRGEVAGGAGGRTLELVGAADVVREEVHPAAVKGFLFGTVGVVLILGGGLQDVQPEGVGGL
jgi:hypothetical protein